jgi:NAD(P)-dependent dehydrogenase (short-subunit alcohol dehydrogenase family)
MQGSDMSLAGKVAIVTGASKGIGKAISLRFAAEGAAVVPASRSMPALTAIANELKSKGHRAEALSVDVCDPASIDKLVGATIETFGRLDILVNNAGISAAHPSESLSTEQWDMAVRTDLNGVFYGCQSAARYMIEQNQGGCIINISSMYGINAAPMRAAYCASKAGVNMLTKVLGSEWGKHHIRVNAIAPGYVRTELVQDLIEKEVVNEDALKRRTPLGRIGQVSDIEGLAVFLAGPEADYITGSVFTIDGGWTAYGYL